MKNDPVVLSCLPAFVAVADAQSFSGAAKELHLSVSAVSQAIKKLELRLGVKLFLRETQGVSLTKPGQLFVDYAHKSLHTLNRGIEQLKEKGSKIRIFTPPGISSLLLNQQLLEELSYHFDNIEMVSDEKPFEGELSDWDIVVYFHSLEHSQPGTHYLGDDLYYPFSLPDIADRITTIEDLSQYTLLYNQHGLAHWDEFFTINQISIPNHRKMYYSRASQLFSAVESGKGIAFESSRIISSKLAKGHFKLCQLTGFLPVMKKSMWLYINPETPIYQFKKEIKEELLAGLSF
ncbi:LysR family transcriptional regulator [Rosenbergiella australiborealis]|uniref:LysR family transcriptional regulator n=1 Tax=Rosenbergiella australiborealis TaxID=1544696 RepID=A0ABS5T4L4_9GAMM|nr:LysR family transcriptional regulator [Rosenbergiella australiborealis]MBT0726420.1 LysR family transcriptional regulator [Rosenbergiella australiborealis]